MTNREPETRACTLVDIPFIRRLSDQAILLDTELEFTRDLHGPSGAILSSMFLPTRNVVTMLAKLDGEQVIGQFRLRENNAQLVFVAPGIAPKQDDSAWLSVLDAMAREAGKLNAQALIGEVDEDSLLFETMRQSGFAVYARQQIWRRLPGDYPFYAPPVILREAVEDDLPAIQGLMARIVPNLLHHLVIPMEFQAGWVHERNGQIVAFCTVSEGRHGLYVAPYIDSGAFAEAAAILHALTQNLQRSAKLPIYVRIRRYQDGMTAPLNALQFEPGPLQAMMVRHLKATVKKPKFRLTQQAMKVVPTLMTYEPSVGVSCQDGSNRISAKGFSWNDALQTISTSSKPSCPVSLTNR